MMKNNKRVLISVSDKTGIIEFAQALVQFGYEIISTGGTARLLINSGIAVIEVSDYTGFPELMDGRLKTLHPRIHGGILGRRGIDDAVMSQHGINPIDLVVVNLYPFAATIARPNCSLSEAIENIDIGGPTLLRAAAKNYSAVTVIVDPADYSQVSAELHQSGELPAELRLSLAVKAFEYSARYEDTIANYFGGLVKSGNATFPRTLNLQFTKAQELRYGENPHQAASFYRELNYPESGIATARQIQGKELSYNNLADSDAAWECVQSFNEPACVIVKHANPCGVAIAENIWLAYDCAYRTDPTSAFGGIIAFNRSLDSKTAAEILQRQFVEVIIAPEIESAALALLANKKNIRVLECKLIGKCASGLDLKKIGGGLLVQEHDLGQIAVNDLTIVTRRAPTESEQADLIFAWKVVKFVKSNAILFARAGMTIGIGAGQMSRVYSARIAALKAAEVGLSTHGSVLASDAFFPFRDGLDQAADAGVSAVIQPGGSMRDSEVIAAADEYNIAMVFTGMRHFRH